jgi:hypothetical protein
MKRISGFLLLTIMLVGLWLPSQAVAQKGRGLGRGNMSKGRLVQVPPYGRARYRGRNRIYYGYKNYGQYRRTQVGNRRWRWQNRYYWRNGVRLTRRVRIYY